MAKKKKPRADLGEFEGSAVVGATLILKNTGDGLSKSMALDPTKLHVGEIISFGGEAEIVGVRHDAADEDTDDLVRVHIAKASVIRIVEPDLLKSVLDEQRERIASAEQAAKDAAEAAKGVQKVPFDGTIKVNEGAGDVPTEAEIAEAERRERAALAEPTPIGELAKKAAAKATREKGTA